MSKLFFSYSHKDESLRDQLEAHLAQLQHQGLVESWHDRKIVAGEDFGNTIDTQLEAADVILLLISSDFINSRYCFSVEMERAMERHAAGVARVIPVILRDCDWHSTKFGKLQAVPKGGRPVTLWPDFDQAFADVARQVRVAVEQHVGASSSTQRAPRSKPERSTVLLKDEPRSSNLRLTREFSERDRDDFLRESYEYILRFFTGSLEALEERNSNVEGRLDRVDSRRFAVSLYRDGKRLSECSIRIDGLGRQNGIAYSSNASAQTGSFNELLSVEAGPHALHFKPLMQQSGLSREVHLSAEGAAEHLWGMLIAPLRAERSQRWP